MNLPKIDLPILEIDTATLGKLPFRPFTVKEERILLTAKEASDENSSQIAVKQIVTNCALSEIDFERFPILDLEWVFLQLRIASIADVVNQIFEDGEDGQEFAIQVNLREVQKPDVTKINRQIPLPNGESILLRLPPVSVYGTSVLDEDFLYYCVEGFIDTSGTPRKLEASLVEFKAWFEGLPIDVTKAIAEFFDTLPTMNYETSYTNSKGTVRKFSYRTLTDFFDWR